MGILLLIIANRKKIDGIFINGTASTNLKPGLGEGQKGLQALHLGTLVMPEREELYTAVQQ